MIGLDTNVIVRYLTQDEPRQARRASSLIENELTEDDPGYLSIVVVVETVWVLQRAYGLTRERVVAVIEAMLQSDVFVIEHEQDVFAATVAVKRDRSQFADALIGRLGERAGCSATFTFDRRAAKLPEFQLLHERNYNQLK